MPYFLPTIFRHGPHLSISTHAWTEQTFRKLQVGELDFGLTGKDIDINDAKLTLLPPADICEQEIYRDNQRCVVRRGHPVLQYDWNLSSYLNLRHVQVRCDGNDRWLLDYRLADLGYERDIAITVPDFNSAASLCTYTDFILPHRATLLTGSPSRWIWLNYHYRWSFHLWHTHYFGIVNERMTLRCAGYEN